MAARKRISRRDAQPITQTEIEEQISLLKSAISTTKAWADVIHSREYKDFLQSRGKRYPEVERIERRRYARIPTWVADQIRADHYDRSLPRVVRRLEMELDSWESLRKTRKTSATAGRDSTHRRRTHHGRS